MTKLRHFYTCLLALCAAAALTACSEDTFGDFAGEGEAALLQLNYQDMSSREVVVMKATSAENALNNLQVFLFDTKGKLKGYKYLSYDELKQDGTEGTFTVKTTTGDTYIYAVANAKTAIYNMQTDGKAIPTDADAWSETEAQLGNIDFTLSDLKAIAFNRESGQKDITEANFMMSGTANGGNLCTIANGSNGLATITSPTAPADQLIRLHRVVAKVTFNVKTGSKAGKTIEFTPTTYDFINVPIEGSLIEGAGLTGKTFEDFTGGSYSAQTPGVFETYLPENLQDAQAGADIVNWNDREADASNEDTKTFTKAPTHGTYVVLNGTYVEKEGSVITRDATVKYYIHLGDFSTDLKDFSVKRNYHYTYNVTVNGVDSIVVQVTAQNDDVQPGAEGIVFDYDTGTSYMLDSHYDYCIMQFNRDEIAALKRKGYGYTFKVKALDANGDLRESGKIVVEGSSTLNDEQTQRLNGVDIDWVRFLKGGTYSQSASHGGTDPGYKALRDANGYTDHSQTNVGYNVVELLSHLYSLSYNSSEWDSNGNITYTCYVTENYYKDFAWGKYVNIDPRTLYIANEVTDSKDERSVYATVKYVVQQYSIKTFYSSDYDGSVSSSNNIIAYGLETIRDDHKVASPAASTVSGSSTWDGMANMKKDINYSSNSTRWNSIDYSYLKAACMSRNRDLNGDGIISDDELRWYCPAIDQYAGMWIGENALTDTKVRCYNGVTTTLSDTPGCQNRTGAEHYFSNTSGMRVFWAEEGMATGNDNGDNNLAYVRCIRNLKSNDLAIGTTADKYYTTSGRTVDMSRIDKAALRTSVQTNELVAHTERGATDKDIANVSQRFTYARYNTKGNAADNDANISSNITLTTAPGTTTMGQAATANYTICSKYADSSSEAGTWRAPNQRELCMMYILSATKDEDKEGCRTTFSGDQIRYSWYKYAGVLQMGTSSSTYVISLRCVRDTK